MAEPLFPHLGIKASQVDSTQKHALGLEIPFDDGTKRRYVRAGAAVAQYDALIIDFAEGKFDWQPSAAATQPIAGVCPVAGVSDNYFFWAITRGPANVKVAAAVTAGAHLASTGTAGTLDDVAAAAADAQAAAAGVGITVLADDTPSAGIALVWLN